MKNHAKKMLLSSKKEINKFTEDLVAENQKLKETIVDIKMEFEYSKK